MIQLILTVVWFAYRASKAGRSILLWSLAALLYMGMVKILFVLLAVNASFTSADQVTIFVVFQLVASVCGAIFIGLMIRKPDEVPAAIPKWECRECGWKDNSDDDTHCWNCGAERMVPAR
ncbi:MAG: hypothetical protein ACRD9S_12835 [Pyrinomonadaceae bacterium]